MAGGEERGAPGGAGAAVVVTGSCGRVGRAAVLALAGGGWDVRGLDAAAAPPAFARAAAAAARAAGAAPPELRRAELGPEVLGELLRGACALVHLAAVSDDAAFASALLPHNVVAAEAAVAAAEREARDRQSRGRGGGPFALIVASSGKVHVGHAGGLPIRAVSPPTPRCAYGATKLFAEALAQAAAHASGGCLRSAAVRFAWCPRTASDVDRMVAASVSPGAGWDEYLSPRDAGACITALVSRLAGEAPSAPPYSLVFCQSLPRGGQQRFDLETVKSLCGWEPRDTFPDGIDAIRDDREYAGAFKTFNLNESYHFSGKY